MAVDENHEDVYIASPTAVYVIHPDESVALFKSGFSGILGLDVYHPPNSSFAILLVADNGAGQIQAVALDNPEAASIPVATGSSLRTATLGRSTFVANDWQLQDLIRLVYVHNSSHNLSRSPVYRAYLNPTNEGLGLFSYGGQR